MRSGRFWHRIWRSAAEDAEQREHYLRASVQRAALHCEDWQPMAHDAARFAAVALLFLAQSSLRGLLAHYWHARRLIFLMGRHLPQAGMAAHLVGDMVFLLAGALPITPLGALRSIWKRDLSCLSMTERLWKLLRIVRLTKSGVCQVSPTEEVLIACDKDERFA